MAHFAQDGGQQGAPFGYISEWPSGTSMFNHYPDSLPQGSILSSDDTTFMESFFSNPDSASMGTDNFNDLGWQVEAKADSGTGTAFGYHFDGFDQNTQTISNPSVTLGQVKGGDYQTHSNQQSAHMRLHADAAFTTDDLEANQASEDDFTAASQLFGLSSHGQHSHAQAFTGLSSSTPAASWGNLAAAPTPQQMAPHDQARQSPMNSMNSSGRQSSNSHHNQSHNPPVSQELMQRLNQRHQQWQQQMWQPQQQNQMQSIPGSQHLSSLSGDNTGDFQFFQNQQMRPMQSGQPRAQHFQRMPVAFGTDQSFSSRGYQPPRSFTPSDIEKASNLNGVPGAEQAAGPNMSHGHPSFTYDARAYPRHGGATNSNPFLPASSTTNHFGGLSMPSPTPTTYPRNHPFSKSNTMARRTIEGDDAEGEIVYEAPKKRKSQVEHEDEAEYHPYGQMSATSSKRGPQAMAGSDDEDDDYDDDNMATPSKRKASIKRRKSNAGTRASMDSDNGSQSAIRSDSGEPASGTKRKARKSQTRNNLTEDQKRQNHIRSERTRRDLIKVQYDALDALVPALRAGKSGLSRADILKEITDFLEQTVEGNRRATQMMMEQQATQQSGAGTGAGAGGGSGG